MAVFSTKSFGHLNVEILYIIFWTLVKRTSFFLINRPAVVFSCTSISSNILKKGKYLFSKTWSNFNAPCLLFSNEMFVMKIDAFKKVEVLVLLLSHAELVFPVCNSDRRLESSHQPLAQTSEKQHVCMHTASNMV